MRFEPLLLSTNRAARHLPLGLPVLRRPAHQALPVPSPGGIGSFPALFAVQRLRCAPPFARAVRPLAASEPALARLHRPWRSLGAFAVRCRTAALLPHRRAGCPSVGGQRTGFGAPPPAPVTAHPTALRGNRALCVPERSLPAAYASPTHSHGISATTGSSHIALRSNRLVHEHQPPFFVSAADSFTSHTQPNPSFNLTRYGLRPPRAS
jgi:hypothetical protein